MLLDIATLESVFKEQAEHEEELRFRNPSFSFWYNWMIAGLVMLLFGCFIWWGISIHRDNRDEAVRAQVLAEMDAEHEQMVAEAAAAEQRKQQEDAELQIREAKAIARALFGIRNFTEKFHYTNSDLLTYARCITNRAEATGKSIEEVLGEPNQFIAYSDKNNLETGLYDLAIQFIADWHAGSLQPCDAKFKYAALEKTGIWLVDDPKKDVPERWHA